MHPRLNPARWPHAPNLLLGLVLGLLALGPGLGRGFLLSYDMVFVPREPFRTALSGASGGPPRAVPSDLAVAVASRVLPADIVQKLVLLLIFVLACAGLAALLDREPVLARLAAGTFYAWNPYVAERLIIGQWALLLGYAGLPLVARAVLKADAATWRGAGRLALALLPAVMGGFAAMAITALAAVPVALATRHGRTLAVTLAALAVGSLPWLTGSLLRTVYADPAGVAAFAARADTPFGTVGSLIMLGGNWNAQTVPKAYGGAWSAIWLAVVLIGAAGYAVLARDRWPRGGWLGLAVAGLAGLAIACLGVTAPGRDLLRDATGFWPGFAVLRDGQQFVAPLALAEAAGLAFAVTGGMHPDSFGRKTAPRPAGRHQTPAAATPSGRHQTPAAADPSGRALAVFALVAPVLLLPGLAWGAAGRLRPAEYPASYLAAAHLIDASPVRGDVLLLPWATDRTPPWNHGEVVLDPWSRLLSRPVIWNDGTQVGRVAMAPDDPRARRLDGVIASGAPLTTALEKAGISFIVDDEDASAAPGHHTPADPRLPGATVVYRRSDLVVYELSG